MLLVLIGIWVVAIPAAVVAGAWVRATLIERAGHGARGRPAHVSQLPGPDEQSDQPLTVTDRVGARAA